jgi:hypothetical protein
LFCFSFVFFGRVDRARCGGRSADDARSVHFVQLARHGAARRGASLTARIVFSFFLFRALFAPVFF